MYCRSHAAKWISFVLLSLLLVVQAAALEPFNPTRENSWAFPTKGPDMAAESPIDLRRLNEEEAGASGRVRLSEDGNGYVLGDGTPVLFWGTHMANGVKYGNAKRESVDNWTMAEYERHARWLARMGVNCVRLGNVAIHDPAPDAQPEKLDPVMVEGVFRRVAAAKKAGIYSQISPVWYHGVKDLGKKLDIEGYDDGNTNVTKLIFFHPEVQRVYKAWIKELYTTKNPHTGLSIAEDPAVFALEVCNEDSLWWYPTDKLKGEPRRMLQKRFGDWAAEKYGSCEKAIAAWEGHMEDEDAPDQGRLELVIMWQLTLAGRETNQVPPSRANDQVRFLIDIQRAFHEDMKRYIREDLGCRQLLSGSNFKSVDTVITEDALRLGYQPLDLICKNNYFGSDGKQDTPGWRLDAGDIMGFHSAVTSPLDLPIRMRQVEGMPFMITETLWPTMHPFETEGPLVLSAYQALTGIDGIYWAGPRDITWNRDPYRRFWTHKGSHPMQVFGNSQPGGMGQFPGAALMLRHAGLKQGPTMVHEYRTREEVAKGEIPLTAEGGYHDFVHADEGDMEQSGEEAVIPASVFLIGRVAVEYVEEDRKPVIRPVEPYLEKGAIHAATGEMTMDTDRDIFYVNAPRAQAVSGFLKEAGPVKLKDVSFTSGNEHGSIILVSLDGQPIATSKKILLQIGMPARPTGWKESKTTFENKNKEIKDGLLIEATGDMPWRIQNTDLTVELRNKSITKATLLNGNGLPERELDLEKTDEGVDLICPPDSMYIIFEQN
ncbi:MAG: hypothetical protein ACOC29_00705 [Candidatus Sumerlaeota bacterium]